MQSSDKKTEPSSSGNNFRRNLLLIFCFLSFVGSCLTVVLCVRNYSVEQQVRQLERKLLEEVAQLKATLNESQDRRNKDNPEVNHKSEGRLSRRSVTTKPEGVVTLNSVREEINKICYNKGTVCLRGSKGEPGSPGEKGAKGDVGPRGFKGNEGYPGSGGIKGETGLKGEPGIPGRCNERCYEELRRCSQCPKGAKGEPGVEGRKGTKGDFGSHGVTGIENIRQEIKKQTSSLCQASGKMCLEGPPGPRGPMGRPGSKGEMGLRGFDGFQGLKGMPGADGLVGETGKMGEPGPKGEPGYPGESGLTGDPGRRGKRGFRGFKGDQGDPGDKGEKGDSCAKENHYVEHH